MKKTTIATRAVIIGLGIAIAIYITRPGSERFLKVFGDSLAVGAAGFAAIATIRVASYFSPGERQRTIWTLIGGGLAFWFLGELSWWIFEVVLGVKVPFPSIADAFWVPGYVPLFIGLLLSFRQLEVRLSPLQLPFR